MKFPVINISEPKWAIEDIMEHIHFDEYFYSGNQLLFERYVLNKQFCDCNGSVFEVVDKIPPQTWWRRVFKFLPNVYREKLIFRKIDKSISEEELKDYLIQRINDLPKNEFNTKWIEFLQNAKSYEELINGEIK